MSIALSTESICGGGMMERLSDALQEALDNIIDPNTDAEAVREVHLKIKIKPNKNRTMGEVQVSTKVNNAPPTPLETTFIIDTDRLGRAVARELGVGEGINQPNLPCIPEEGRALRAVKGAD
jgi:hypothetical protein